MSGHFLGGNSGFYVKEGGGDESEDSGYGTNQTK